MFTSNILWLWPIATSTDLCQAMSPERGVKVVLSRRKRLNSLNSPTSSPWGENCYEWGNFSRNSRRKIRHISYFWANSSFVPSQWLLRTSPRIRWLDMVLQPRVAWVRKWRTLARVRSQRKTNKHGRRPGKLFFNWNFSRSIRWIFLKLCRLKVIAILLLMPLYN